jgi:hypothetical protein
MRTIKALVLSLPSLALLGGQVAIGLTASSIFSAPVYAADKQVSAKVGKPLKEAQELDKAKKLKEAIAKVQEAQAISGKTPFEELKINEFLAYLEQRSGDNAGAAKAYEATLESGQLSQQQQQQRLDQIIKLYSTAKNYPKVIQLGGRYLKDFGGNTDIALQVAQAYYIQKDYSHAIEATQNLIKIAAQNGKPAQEEWLKLLMACQYALNKDQDQMATLEQLLIHYPSQNYWRDMLIDVSKNSGSDRQNLEVFRLKLATGVLKESEYLEMAQLALAVGLPGEANKILDKGFASKTLGTGPNKDRELRMRDKAQKDQTADQAGLSALEKQAQAAADGEADVKLGDSYASYGDYAKAIEAIKRGMSKGNLKAPDEARLSLGQAYMGAKRWGEATAQFKAVAANSKLSRIAKLWAIQAQNSKG